MQGVIDVERALRTRPDYDFRCEDCGAPHNLDTSIPSVIWNAICRNGTNDVGALCTLCIDDRMAAAGLTGEAEFYFVGKALKSKLYVPPTQGDVEFLVRSVRRVLEDWDRHGGPEPWVTNGWNHVREALVAFDTQKKQ